MSAKRMLTIALPFWHACSKILSTDHEDSGHGRAAIARRPMARPREFDETTVLEAAMNCFWAQGFEQTSVRDLAERMGITGASLYNAFGDKRSLYRRAFVHYLAQTVRDRVRRLEKLPPLTAIRTFFDEIIERSVDDDHRRIDQHAAAALLVVARPLDDLVKKCPDR